MAFPGDVDRAKVAGCLALIRDGALLVRDIDDVVAALPSFGTIPAAITSRCAYEPQSELERRLLRALHDAECDVDALLAGIDHDPGHVLAALADLELAGAIERRGGRSYALAKA